MSFAYPKGGNVLSDASASFGVGIHLLLGPNGAGKTTLMKIMAGLLCPQSGECVFEKEAMTYHSPHAVKEVFLLTDDMAFPLDTVDDMARLHAPFYPNFSEPFLKEALASFGLIGTEKLKDLSLGNRRKAQVAYALALGTKVLLLDEPANGLDIPSKKTLATLIGKAMDEREERCIVVATHTVQEMRNLFDSVTILNHGRIVLNAMTQLISERVAFINDPVQKSDAICFSPSIDGACQILPNDGTRETPIDFNLLFTAAIGDNSDSLRGCLTTDVKR